MKSHSKSHQYWLDFYDHLDSVIGKEIIANLAIEHKDDYKEFSKKYNLLQVEAVQKLYSSTHIWDKGKSRYEKSLDNWYQSPLECKVCKMGASEYHELGWARTEYVKVEGIDIPSKDMHCSLIHRTCAEVLQAKRDGRKNKETKCIQCNTFGCHL